MNQWWQLWEQYFSEEECDKIIELGMLRSAREASIGHGGVGRTDSNVRRSTLRWLDRRDEDLWWMINRIEHAFRFANCNAFQFELSYFKEIQFTEYNSEDEGKYDWHEDISWTKNGPSRRKLSIVVQLTDPHAYTGGDLELYARTCGGDDQVPKAKGLRSRGTVLVFPSFLRHRVTPVLKGTRHSLVSWYEGPPFR